MLGLCLSLFCTLPQDITSRVYLDELDPGPITQGWGIPQISRSVSDNVLTMGGQPYRRGIGTYASSRWAFKVDGRAKSFQATVGIDDATGGRGSVEFLVLADKNIVARSGLLRSRQSAFLKASLAGAQEVSLVVSNGGDGNGHDHANWCDAFFTMSGSDARPVGIWPATKKSESWLFPMERFEADPLAMPIVTLPLHFISTADDDGTNPRNFPRDLIPGIVRYMNECFAEARVRFECDPDRDYEVARSTLLNRDFAPDSTVYSDRNQRPPGPPGKHDFARRNEAFRLPRKLVIIARRGSTWSWKEEQNRWVDEPNFINTGGALILTAARSQDPEMFVHEMGHVLGLPHTFGERARTVPEVAAIIQRAIENGLPPERGLEALDGDRWCITDTPPDVADDGLYHPRRLFADPPIRDIPVALKDGSIRVYRLAPDPFNHMSYFMEARKSHPKAHRILGHFSRQQILAVRRMAEQRFDDRGDRPDHSTSPWPVLYEFERLKLTSAAGNTLVQENQRQFVPPGRDPGRQLVVLSQIGTQVGFMFDVKKDGRYHVWWRGSYAGNYGQFAVTLDERELNSFDGWAVEWRPTGWRRFGETFLKKGQHKIAFTATGQHPMSKGANMGLDSLALQGSD